MGKIVVFFFQVKIYNDYNLDVVRRSYLDIEVYSGVRIFVLFYVLVFVFGCFGDLFEFEVYNNQWIVGYYLKNKLVLFQ